MSRKPVDHSNMATNRNILPKNPDRLFSIQHIAATRSLSLITSKQKSILFARQSVRHVVQDAATGTHTASRNDDAWFFDIIQCLGAFPSITKVNMRRIENADQV